MPRPTDQELSDEYDRRQLWRLEDDFDDYLERAAGGTPNTGNCPEVSMPTHRDNDTAC